MKFARCEECGFTVPNDAGQRVTCTGDPANPLRRHPQTVAKDISAEEALELFAGDTKEAAATLGVDEDAFTEADAATPEAVSDDEATDDLPGEGTGEGDPNPNPGTESGDGSPDPVYSVYN